jgi:hypothetical protein
MPDLPIVCTLTDSELQKRRADIEESFRERLQESRPLDNGYAFRFNGDDASLNALVDLIRLERACCRFLQFQLKLDSGNGPLWLEITGPEGTRNFIETELLPAIRGI